MREIKPYRYSDSFFISAKDKRIEELEALNNNLRGLLATAEQEIQRLRRQVDDWPNEQGD